MPKLYLVPSKIEGVNDTEVQVALDTAKVPFIDAVVDGSPSLCPLYQHFTHTGPIVVRMPISLLRLFLTELNYLWNDMPVIVEEVPASNYDSQWRISTSVVPQHISWDDLAKILAKEVLKSSDDIGDLADKASKMVQRERRLPHKMQNDPLPTGSVDDGINDTFNE